MVVVVETGWLTQRPPWTRNRWDLTLSTQITAKEASACSRDRFKMTTILFTQTTAESRDEGKERDVGEFTLYNPVVEKHERSTRTRHDIITTVSLSLASRYATNCDALCNLTPFYQNQHQRLQQFE